VPTAELTAPPAAAPGQVADVRPPALELRGVRAGYGRINVLQDLDLVVPAGSVVALLGPNGAGKTTTLALASGKLRPTAGCLHVAGTHVNGASPAALARAGVCRIPEGRGIFPTLTVAENLRLVTFAAPFSAAQVADQVYDRFPKLLARRSQVAGTLSGGEQQMLAMGRALVTQPGLLLLDEISMGLAPLVVAELYELVGQLATEGISILLVEQFAPMALAVADYAALMVGGRIVRMGQPADVTGFVNETYLGGSA
jgi:branched-chain amino acid transport system ATP-binding protein